MNKTKRRILSAGVGLAAITALGGLACGNPVEPGCPGDPLCPIDAKEIDAPAGGDAHLDAPDVDAGVDAPIDAATAQKP